MIARRLASAIGCGLLIAGAIVSTSLTAGSPGATTGRTTRLVAPSGVWFLSPTVGWVTDDYGQRLLMTSDGGRSWVNVSPPVLGRPRSPQERVLAGVLFESRSSFWAAVYRYRGGLGPVELLHTTDGGRMWTDVRSFARDDGYVWIDFLDTRRGWVMVGNGDAAGSEPVTIYGTGSSGTHWTELASSGGPMSTGTRGAPSSYCDKSGISFSNPSSGWITGFCNGVVQLDHTLDGGAHWRSVRLTKSAETEYGGNTLSPRFFTARDGAFVAALGGRNGGRSFVYTTTTAGVRWTAHALPGVSGGAVSIVSPTSWVAAAAHTLYMTSNAGASWRSREFAIGSVSGSSGGLDFLTPADGWAITSSGPRSRLWHTTTGGRHWTRIG